MPSISYVYTKLRKSFGKQPLFQSVPAHMIDSILPTRIEERNYCLRNPVHREVQATKYQSEHEANTNQVILHNTGINHTEGGWPKDVHLNNEEHILRHRRRICHEEGYIHSVKSVAPVMEHYIDQNNAIEMYQTYFTEYAKQNPVETYQIRVNNSFADEFRRPVSSIAWTIEPQSKLAVAYSYRSNNSMCLLDEDMCYIWDIERQNEPAHEIQPPCSCWQLACSPIEPEVLVGGLQDGTVCLFDIRDKEEPVSISPRHISHREPITALLFSHSRTNTEFFTGAPDGQCFWWDMRNLSEPLDNLSMSIRISAKEEPNLSNAEGVSCLQFDRGFPTRFLCGTESGLVINVNRMGRSHSEVLASYWDAHWGPVNAVHRSPCTSRMFLTCGDWFVKIWSEDVRSDPIIVTEPYPSEVTDAAWAPLRWSSFMAICANGVFYYWDILRKQHQPISKLAVSNYMLSKVTPHYEDGLVAVGDTNGSTFLIHLSDNMTWPGPSDKVLVSQIYERQRRREHILEARIKELRLKARLEEEMAKHIQEEDPNEDELCEEAEEEYFKIVNKELNITTDT